MGTLRRWLEADLRVLALFRIAFGVLLLANLYDRMGGGGLLAFYSNEGILPDHYALFLPLTQGYWSLLSGFSSPNEVRFAVTVVALLYALYTVGYRTRLMQVLVALCCISIDLRFLPVQHGGNVVMNVLVVWTVFLPLGARWSVDRLFATLRAHRESGAEALNARAWNAAAPTTHVGLAVLGATANFATIYFFNAFHKTGAPGWDDGSMVHWVLWQSRIATGLASVLRLHEPAFFSPLMTWGTLVIEWVLPFTILAPNRALRLFSWVSVQLLHGGIALLSTLGPFSYAMMIYATLLLSGRDLAWAGAQLARRTARREVRFDASNPAHLFAVRVLARLDGLERLTFAEARAGAPFAVKREGQGAFVEGVQACGQALRALPFGFLVSWPFAWPRLGDLARWTVRTLARLGAERDVARAEVAEGPLHRRARLAVQIAGPMLLFPIVVTQVMLDSWKIAEAAKPRGRPQAFDDFVRHTQMLQGWSMFAPGLPLEDARLVVDATLSDGSHLDPLTGAAPDFEPGNQGPFFMDQQWCEFHARMPGWTPHWRNVRDFLMRTPRREGWPEGRTITALEVYSVTWKSPPFGQTQVSGWQRRKLFDDKL
ncbi:MAG: lipase maturation factor family protein [Myxococcaceae bacterium]|nr:lipase maturation factor family protein [Myxococcaceae bacterium]